MTLRQSPGELPDSHDDPAPEEIVRGLSAAGLAELARLSGENRLTPDDVVAEAQNPASPLHDRFTWDDAEAAHLHRLNEARTLIRGVRIVIEVRDVQFKVPRYVHVSDEASAQGYRDALALRKNRPEARRVVAQEVKNALGACRRAANLAVALGLDSKLLQVTDQLVGILSSLESK